MKANRQQIERALDAPGADTRIFLLYGPDEAGSMALMKRLERAMGEGAERIDLDGVALKSDPARLADEAASLSMFGDRRWIRISGTGEESLAAVQALLEAGQAGNPVVALAGALRNTAKLVKLCLDHPAAMAFASYEPDAREAEQIASALAKDLGLRLSRELARRVAQIAGNDRALMAGELEKLALYLDASPEHPTDATPEALDALSAQTAEANVGPLVNAVLEGDISALRRELAMLAASGTALASATRPLLGRAMLLGEIQAEFEKCGSLDRAMESAGKAVFWKDKPHVQRQLRCWGADSIGRLMHRLLAAERMTRNSRGPGEVAVKQELLAIARQAARAR